MFHRKFTLFNRVQCEGNWYSLSIKFQTICHCWIYRMITNSSCLILQIFSNLFSNYHYLGRECLCSLRVVSVSMTWYYIDINHWILDNASKLSITIHWTGKVLICYRHANILLFWQITIQAPRFKEIFKRKE